MAFCIPNSPVKPGSHRDSPKRLSTSAPGLRNLAVICFCLPVGFNMTPTWPYRNVLGPEDLLDSRGNPHCEDL